MIAANIMFTDMVTMRCGNTLGKALELMNEKQTRQIAVVDDDRRIIGLLTTERILQETLVKDMSENSLKDVEFPSTTKGFLKSFWGLASRDISETMDRDLIKVVPETSAVEISRIFLNPEKRVEYVVVVDDRDVLLGIITPLDVIKRLCEHT
jgi:CBS-domain-containing membrane protein